MTSPALTAGVPSGQAGLSDERRSVGPPARRHRTPGPTAPALPRSPRSATCTAAYPRPGGVYRAGRGRARARPAGAGGPERLEAEGADAGEESSLPYFDESGPALR